MARMIRLQKTYDKSEIFIADTIIGWTYTQNPATHELVLYCAGRSPIGVKDATALALLAWLEANIPIADNVQASQGQP
jgi:hypothetical protein